MTNTVMIVQSLYEQCLREVLKTRDIQLFMDLALLQIKRDPLEGKYADLWVDSAAENPLVLDWLVIFTNCRLCDLMMMVYPNALHLCCVDTLEWFIEPLNSELNMSNPNHAYYEIMTWLYGNGIGDSDDDDSGSPYYCWEYEYSRSKWSFLNKDHLETAMWLIKHECISSFDIWYRLVRIKPTIGQKFTAKKIAEYLAEEPNQEHRKLKLAELKKKWQW